ncbi:type VII secretion system-associated protein [Saccharopolyspora shandongensis]|uniref:type VII secretion system-associated protein n=1 Tax=Saccharopolyspora shandongensis TaxID=418495 RepID=UPI0033EBB523
MRAQARQQPGSKIIVIDPEFDQGQQVPGWGIRGGYPVTANGDIDSDGWHPNPNYRPGPRTLGWPLPDNAVERALELVAAGYAPPRVLHSALASAELHALTDEAGAVIVLGGQNDEPLLACYTSTNRTPDTVRTTALPVQFIAQQAANLDAIVLNPDRTPSLAIRVSDLVGDDREGRKS